VAHTTLRSWEVRGVCPQPLQLRALAAVLGRDVEDVRALAGSDRVRTALTSGGAGASPLCRARLSAGLTMTQLARKVGVGPAAVSRWENGLRTPDPAVRPRPVAALRLTPDELVRALGDRAPSRADGALLPGLGQLRRDAGLTQRAFRHELGIGATTTNVWEHGRVRVPVTRLADVAAALGVNPEILLARASRPPCPSVGERPLAALRRGAGLTQRELAFHLGVSVRSVVHWEAATRPVPPAVVRPLARCLRAPLAAVLAAAGLELPVLARPASWTPEQLPEVLATLRRSSGWSAAALGRRLGVAGRTVRTWETGAGTPSASAVRRLELLHSLPQGCLIRLLTGGGHAMQARRAG
jgi:transcriptional regulator with XRE-family HTH domain